MLKDETSEPLVKRDSNREPIKFYHPFGNPFESASASHTDFSKHDFGAKRRSS